MQSRILEKIFKNIPDCTEEYMDAIENRIANFLEYTQLPRVYQINGLDINYLPYKLKGILPELFDIVEKPLNKLVLLQTYKESGFIVATLLEQYIINCIVKDLHIPSMLYIDTNLLIEDYKKYIDISSGEGNNSILVHSPDILFKEILTADFVFWDKFTMVDTNYATAKIYDILSIRYRQCLGNMFFATGGIDAIQNMYNIEMLNVMNLSNPIINLENDEFRHIN